MRWLSLVFAVCMLPAITSAASHSEAPALRLPTVSKELLISDTEPSEIELRALPEVIDERKLSTEDSLEGSVFTFSSQRYKGRLVDAIRTDFSSYANQQWESAKVMRQLGANPVRVRSFAITYALRERRAEERDGLPPLLSMLLRKDAETWQYGDLRVSIEALVAGKVHIGTASLRMGENTTVTTYATRPLVRKALEQLAESISKDQPVGKQ
jgi:hypothetical protein